MARRTRTSDLGDSLDLLLDTICNVFGGIVFIAMLLALLTGAQTRQVEAQAQAPPDSAVQIATVQARIDDYQRGLTQLHKTQAMLDRPQIAAALASLTATTSAQAEADARRDELQQWLASFERMTAGDPEQQIEARRQAAQDQVAQLERRLAELEQQHQQKLRLPAERVTSKTQVMLILEAGKVHWVPLGPAADLFARTFAHDVTVTTPLLGDAVIAACRPDGGFRVGPQLTQDRRFQQLVAGADPARYFFDLYVAEDSAEAFGLFKEAILQRGYHYNVTPYRKAQGLAFSSVDTLHVQ